MYHICVFVCVSCVCIFICVFVRVCVFVCVCVRVYMNVKDDQTCMYNQYKQQRCKSCFCVLKKQE